MKNKALTPEMTAKIPTHVKEWVDIGLSTEPADFDAAERGVLGCYAAAGLDRPKIILRMSSPYGAVFGAAIAATMWESVDAQVGDQVGDQLKTVFDSYQGGNLWAGWYAFVTYLRDVYGFSGDKLSDFAHDELIARNAGWTIWGKDICAISDKPELLLRDDGGRLHSTVGPAIKWRDGYSLYAWHGVRIPPGWVKGEFPTAHEMLHWKNIEQRRAGCSMMGWANILKEINAKIIDKDPNPMIGTLMEADIPDSGIERFLVVECGTGRKGIVLPVSREAKTAHEANASTWMYSDAKLYNPEVRT